MAKALEKWREKHHSIFLPSFYDNPDGPLLEGLDSLNKAMSEKFLIHFSGQDHPGQTTVLTGILAEYDACVLDIGQAVVHETLALGLLVEVPDRDFGLLRSALVESSRDLGLQVRFTP